MNEHPILGKRQGRTGFNFNAESEGEICQRGFFSFPPQRRNLTFGERKNFFAFWHAITFRFGLFVVYLKSYLRAERSI